jgi:hypothetical protein
MYSHPVYCQMFRRAVRFRIHNVADAKNSLYFSQPFIIVVMIVDNIVIVIVFEIQVT